jgi:predicted nucleotidyltransferase
MWRTWRAESGAVYFDEGGVASTWATQLWHTEMGRVADRRRTQKPMPEGLLQRADPRLSAKLSSVLLALRRQLRELYGDRLVKLLLYGSQARGDATPWSDVDLLVVLKGRVRPSEEITRTGGIVCGVCLEYDAVIQCLFMDEERFCGSGSPLLRNVFREAIEV